MPHGADPISSCCMNVYSGFCDDDKSILQVREVFDESPFFVPENSVSIMNGANEGNLPLNVI